MNVASMPCRREMHFTMRRKRMAWSQASSGSAQCMQVDLELPRAVFGQRGAGGHVLRATGRVDGASTAEYSLRSAIELICVRYSRRPGEGSRRRLRQAHRGALAIDEVELQFDGDDRRQAPAAKRCVTCVSRCRGSP